MRTRTQTSHDASAWNTPRNDHKLRKLPIHKQQKNVLSTVRPDKFVKVLTRATLSYSIFFSLKCNLPLINCS